MDLSNTEKKQSCASWATDPFHKASPNQAGHQSKEILVFHLKTAKPITLSFEI